MPETYCCNIVQPGDLFVTDGIPKNPETVTEIAQYNQNCLNAVTYRTGRGTVEALPGITIEEGTTITNTSGTFRKIVGLSDKNIKVRGDLFEDGRGRETTLMVVPKKPVSPPRAPLVYPLANGKLITVPFVELAIRDFTIVLPDNCICRTSPFTGYHVWVQSRGRSVQAKEKNELTALETFREMITEREFRKYIKYGFINVEAKSRRVYQIFRDKWHIKVWDQGALIEEICVRIKDKKIPPTDNVIALMILIETDEEEFKRMGNVYKLREAA